MNPIMKSLTALLVCLICTVDAAAQTKGPNGGMVVKVDDHPIEFVVRGQDILFYVGGHDGKPMATKGLQARAIVQSGGATSTVTLSPMEPNLFIGKLSAPLGAKARVVFSSKFEGHSLQARFVTE